MGSSGSADALEQVREWLQQQAGQQPRSAPAARAGAALDSAIRDAGDGHRAPTATPAKVAGNNDAEADPESAARAILVRKLAAQDRTRHELASALASKHVPKEVAERLLDRYEEIGLIDDEEFARRWVETRRDRRYRSRLALRRELAAKGIDRAVVDLAVSELSADDEDAAARSYVEKAAVELAALDPLVRRRRLAGRLARRGFGPDVIGRALKHTE